MKENLMIRKNIIQQLLICCLAASATTLALAEGAGTPNASTSSGSSNADIMAPGATGAGVPKGAGDTSASGTSAAGTDKSMKKGPARIKRQAKPNSQTDATSKPVQ
jgi:hypothetical protein